MLEMDYLPFVRLVLFLTTSVSREGWVGGADFVGLEINALIGRMGAKEKKGGLGKCFLRESLIGAWYFTLSGGYQFSSRGHGWSFPHSYSKEKNGNGNFNDQRWNREK